MSANSYPLFSKRLQKSALHNAKHSSIPKGTLEWFESRQRLHQQVSHNTTPSQAVPPGLKKREKVQKQNDPYEDELLRIPSYDLFLYQDIDYTINEPLFNYKNLLEYVDEVMYSTPLFTSDN